MKLPIILITLVLLFAGCTTQTDTEVIEIGLIAPLTGSASAYGEPLVEIAELARQDINAQGGINGKQLVFLVEDGKCNPKDASLAAQKLIQQDSMKIIYGGLCSGETLGASKITEQNSVILFSSASTATAISDAGDFVFRNFPHVGLGATRVAEVARDNGVERIAIISELTEYSTSVRENFKTRFEELGGVVAVDDQFKSDTTDFRTSYAKATAQDVDAIYIVGQAPITIEALVRQKGELGIEIPFYADIVAAGKAIREKYPEEMEGTIFAEPYLDESSLEVQQFFSRLEQELGKVPDSLPNLYWTAAYDAVHILSEAIELCGEDSICIRDHLYAIDGRIGLSGSLVIDEKGDAEMRFVLKQVRDGQAIDLET